MSSNLTDPNLRDSQHQNKPTELHDPLSEPVGETAGRKVSGHSTGAPFNITFLNPINSPIPAHLIQQSLAHNHGNGQTPTTLLICNHQSKAKDKDIEEDVSEEFVKNYNDHIGNKDNQDKARRLIQKMKVLGGLDPNHTTAQLDIPAARMGFAILAGLKNYQHKMTALKNLRKLLAKDEIKKETAIDLVSLAMKVMNKMDRELIQTEIMDVQIEIAKAYGAIAELLQHHYAEKHINAITKELKAQLANTARTLEDLNRQEDTQLAYAVSFALEGIKRLRDDRKELFELLLRIYHTVMAAASVYQTDMQAAISEIDLAFKGINPNIKSSWYDGVLLLHVLAKDAKSNYNVLMALQTLIAQKHKDLNWRFLYESINVLTDISINGTDEKIRRSAFEGLKTLAPEFPGVISFKDYKAFSRTPDLSPIVHFDPPRLKDHNIIIRTICVENLIKIAEESSDPCIRAKAKNTLTLRLKEENDPDIKALLTKAVPANRHDLRDWLDETGKYTRPQIPPIVTDPDATKTNGTGMNSASSIANPQITNLFNQIVSPTPVHPSGSTLVSTDQSNLPSIIILTPPASKPSTPGFDDESSVSSNKSLSREPNRIAKRLAGCLGVDPEFLAAKLRYHGDIRPVGKTGLAINDRGMVDLVDLLISHHKIERLDLGICGKSVEGLTILFSELPKTGVNRMSLQTRITRDQSKHLAFAIHAKKELKVELRGPKEYYLLGHALSRKGEIDESIVYYSKGIESLNKKEIEKKLQSKLYFRRGLAYMLNGEVALAIEDLEKVMKIDPTCLRAAVELSKLYRQNSQIEIAKSWALKAYHLSPTNRDVNRLLKQF